MTLPASYFDRIYEIGPDPWGLDSRWYEKRKYALTIASLPRLRYRRGVEIGCSIGVLTSMLAARCTSLVAVDIADNAVLATRARLQGRPGIEVVQLAVPSDWPEGRFDLVVLSEVGYYLSRPDLDDLLEQAVASLDDDGALVAVHWRHHAANYPLRGDEVHEAIAVAPGLERLVRHEEEDFLLEVFVPAPAVSVARTTGVL